MSGHVMKARTDHQHAARQARQLPGTWVLAGTYGSRASATSASLQVRTGHRLPSYLPAGSFRARVDVTQDGADLWVCYVADDFRESVQAGLTEDLDAFSSRMDAAALTTRRT
ncbi:hypothetical protein [Streptomyces chartreusis]|uniref:hypothetical protein n=1 Tax=Streptomyces chartreusis TaxID=1969 RepID=UPI0038095E96